jgi:hypothetical protein
VTETDSANERPPVQEDSQSKECDANHDPEHGCVREDQDRDTDQRCDYPERSHGAFSHRLTPLGVSVLLLRWSTTAGRRDEQPESRSRERSFRSSRVADTLEPSLGRLAYFDDEAQTYMVLTRDGVLVSAPLSVEGPLGTTPVHPVFS